MKNRFLLFLFFCSIVSTAMAQGTIEDYNRAYALKEKYQGKVFYSGVNPTWMSNNSFWYIRHTPEGEEYVRVEADKARRVLLFDHKKMAKALSQKTGRNIAPNRLSLQQCKVTTGADTLTFVFNNRRWSYAVKNNQLTDVGPAVRHQSQPTRHWSESDDEKMGRPVTSPDGKYVAYVRDYNLFVRPARGGAERQLSFEGTIGNYYSAYLYWSPDSRKIALTRIRPVEKRYIYYVESSPRNQLQPRLHKQEYAKPGDELPFKVPHIYDVESGEGLTPAIDLFASQYDLNRLRWTPDSRSLLFEYNERGHKVYRLLEMSAADASVRTVIEEIEEKYVNYTRLYRHHFADGHRILWSSERDGYNHLYLYDRSEAKEPKQITRGAWYVRAVQRVDEENGWIYFSANGMNADEDPYFIHYYRVRLDGTDLTDLTPAEGMHKVWYSGDYRYLVDVYSQVDVPPVAVLRDACDGHVVMELEHADISPLVAQGWRAPESFVAKGRDGKTDMWGVIYRPSDFDSTRTYPIVEYIYSGPGDHYVPKTFVSYTWTATSLAELGFIVVQVDGMTTSFRSKAFEEVCYKNLKDGGLPDHIAWIKAAAEKYPYMDTTRVGIYGCSAGGQEAMAAVLFHPDFYKAAYAACGCHDNRMDKIWWNEQWMGYPVDESYKASSNVENAHLLSRPLMLVVGELDDNVDPASTMQVADALIRANKDFELIVLPGAKHTVGEAYGEHKRYDFFVRHLMGAMPPKWSDVKSR